MDTETRLNELEAWKESMESSNSIPRDVETALRKRLGVGGQTGFNGIFGVTHLSSGFATITDSRITSSSTIVATSQNSYTSITFNGTIAAVCNSGNAVIFSSGGISSDPVNYVILF